MLIGCLEPTLPEFETQLKVRGKGGQKDGKRAVWCCVVLYVVIPTLSLSLSLSHSHSHSLTLTRSHTLSLSHSLTLPLSLSPSPQLKHFVNVEAEIAGIASEHVIGALALNTTNLKLQFSQASEEWKVTYSQNLQNDAKAKLEDLSDYMKTTSGK